MPADPILPGAAADDPALPVGTVLLTRPEPDSRRVADQLAGDGIATAIWPLTRIAPRPGPIRIAPGTGGLIFTSQNAVRAVAEATAGRALRAWCVGDRTASVARAAGFADVVSAGGDVADLAQLLARAPPARLLYMRGRCVSADLPALLAGTDHRIDTLVVYCAEPTGPPPHRVAAGLRAGRVGTVALWSRLAATVLARHLADHPDWPVDAMRAVAISVRAGQPLEGCGLAGLTVPDRPDGAAMLAAIRAAVRQ